MPSSTTSGIQAPPSRTAVHGSALAFEELACESAVTRLRASEDTLLRVIAGPVLLAVGDDERVLAAGEETIIAAGVAHRLSGLCGAATILTGFRAATR